MYSYLIRYYLLSDQQFGFRKNSSTTLAISKLLEELLTNIDHGLYTCSVVLDSTPTTTLSFLDRLFDIRKNGLDILKSYLLNQYQHTKSGNINSTKRKISCGVPQNSTLGPLLLFSTSMTCP